MMRTRLELPESGVVPDADAREREVAEARAFVRIAEALYDGDQRGVNRLVSVWLVTLAPPGDEAGMAELLCRMLPTCGVEVQSLMKAFFARTDLAMDHMHQLRLQCALPRVLRNEGIMAVQAE